MKKILWCITGAGGHLRSVHKTFMNIKKAYPTVELGIALSKAGEEVARIYGVLDKLNHVASGGRYGGIYKETTWSGITEDGVPLGGRVSLRRYDVVAVAPATSNSVAKILHGIADTLPTLVASQALKSDTPVIILPADCAENSVTTLPCRVDEPKCTGCLLCVESCPHNAIRVVSSGETVRIDYNWCRGCETCVAACSPKAIRCWEKMVVTPSSIDLENVEKLGKIQGVHVVTSDEELSRKLRELLNI